MLIVIYLFNFLAWRINDIIYIYKLTVEDPIMRCPTRLSKTARLLASAFVFSIFILSNTFNVFFSITKHVYFLLLYTGK